MKKNPSCLKSTPCHLTSINVNTISMHRLVFTRLPRSSSSSPSLCCIRHASSSSASASSSMHTPGPHIALQHLNSSSRRKNSDKDMFRSTPSPRRHYASSNLQNQPPASQQQREQAVQKPADSDQDYHGAFGGPALHTLGVATRELLLSSPTYGWRS